MTWYAYFLILFGLSWGAVGLFRDYAIRKGMIDKPNGRSSHVAPTPRGGGVVFVLGFITLFAVLLYFHYVDVRYAWLLSPALLIGVIGFWDDHKSLSATVRFVVQCVAAAISLFLLSEGGDLLSGWLPLPLPLCFLALVVSVVWMTNLFNFMDGSDGIAATEGIFVFGMGGFILYHAQIYDLALLAIGLTALLAGFLVWNWPLAKIFMGDSGSCFLGFMTALFALISYKFFQMPLLIWAILTAFFWFDATATLLRRMLAGEEWRKPHRSHAYQRLIQAGWKHEKVLVGAIAVNSVLAGLAWLGYQEPRLLTFSFGLTLTFLSCVYLGVEIFKPMYKPWYKT